MEVSPFVYVYYGMIVQCKMSPGFKWHHILLLFVSEFELQHVDEFIDELLHAERMCDIILPRLQVSLPPCMCSHPFSLT